MTKRFLTVLPVLAVVGACASNHIGAGLPSGGMAYDVVPAATSVVAPTEYQIGPLDALDITVLEEPDLSTKASPVDAFGNVNLPLIGDVRASGKTAGQLAKEVAARYSQKYLRNPQVSIVVAKAVAQKVAVQGEVVEPGIYPIEGPTTFSARCRWRRGNPARGAQRRGRVPPGQRQAHRRRLRCPADPLRARARPPDQVQ